MDTKQKENLLYNNLILLLPDDEDKVDGPASLVMVPRDAIMAWIKMTPELSEAYKTLQLHMIKKLMMTSPAEFKRFIDSEDKDNEDVSFAEVLLNDEEFKKTYKIIAIAALIDLRKTMGFEEFGEAYTVTDPELIQEFTQNSEWSSYETGDGWSKAENTKGKFDIQVDGSGINIAKIES